MKKKGFFGVLALLVGFAVVFGFTACDDGSGPDGGGGGGGGGGGNSGWPNNTVLAEYGLSGATAPTGATGITYSIATVGGNSLTIRFTGSSANDSSIDAWFTSYGWSPDNQLTQGDIHYRSYTKAGFDEANYTRNTSTNACQIQVAKN